MPPSVEEKEHAPKQQRRLPRAHGMVQQACLDLHHRESKRDVLFSGSLYLLCECDSCLT